MAISFFEKQHLYGEEQKTDVSILSTDMANYAIIRDIRDKYKVFLKQYKLIPIEIIMVSSFNIATVKRKNLVYV